MLLGKEFRELFCVDEGNSLIGVDQSALEARCEAHWTFKYDNGTSAYEILEGDIHCLSSDTQILTKNGWKYFNEITLNDYVCQWNIITEEFSYVNPQEVIFKKFKGELIKLKYKNIELLFTKNHRCLFYDYLSNSFITILAENLIFVKKDYLFLLSSDNKKIGISNFEISTIDYDDYIGCVVVHDSYILVKRNDTIFVTGNSKNAKAFFPEETQDFDINSPDFNKDDKKFKPYRSLAKNGKYCLPMDTQILTSDGWKYFNEVGIGDTVYSMNGNYIEEDTILEKHLLVDNIYKWSNKLISFECTDNHRWYGWVGNNKEYISFETNEFTDEHNILLSLKFKQSLNISTEFSFKMFTNGIIINKNFEEFNSISCKGLKKQLVKENTDVFCITTNRGSFVIKQDTNIMLTGNCITYGGSAGKLATTLRKPEEKGKELFDIFWSVNNALKSLKDDIEKEWRYNGKKFITGIDGRRLYTRSQHSLVNLLFQSTGAIIVDYALCLFDDLMGELLIDELGRPYYIYKDKIVKRVQYTHDEFGVECDSSIAEEMSKIVENVMIEAGKILNIQVPLGAESKIGFNWKETH